MEDLIIKNSIYIPGETNFIFKNGNIDKNKSIVQLVDETKKYQVEFPILFSIDKEQNIEINFNTKSFKKFADEQTNTFEGKYRYGGIFSKYQKIVIYNKSSFSVSFSVYGISTILYQDEKTVFENGTPYIINSDNEYENINEKEIRKLKEKTSKIDYSTAKVTQFVTCSPYDCYCTHTVESLDYRDLFEIKSFIKNFFINDTRKYDRKEFSRYYGLQMENNNFVYEMIDSIFTPNNFFFVNDIEFFSEKSTYILNNDFFRKTCLYNEWKTFDYMFEKMKEMYNDSEVVNKENLILFILSVISSCSRNEVISNKEQKEFLYEIYKSSISNKLICKKQSNLQINQNFILYKNVFLNFVNPLLWNVQLTKTETNNIDKTSLYYYRIAFAFEKDIIATSNCGNFNQILASLFYAKDINDLKNLDIFIDIKNKKEIKI